MDQTMYIMHTKFHPINQEVPDLQKRTNIEGQPLKKPDICYYLHQILKSCSVTEGPYVCS